MKIKKINSIAFPFVLDLLSGPDYYVKPMFGCHAIYKDEKILIILRNKNDSISADKESNGVWIATEFDHHDSLIQIFPCLRDIKILSPKGNKTAWQMIPSSADSFEEDVALLCQMILKGDKRIGKIPNRKR